MHRVELKVPEIRIGIPYRYLLVPNAPCGVESFKFPLFLHGLLLLAFLMHRVELKGEKELARKICAILFLMHRVELKVLGDTSSKNWNLKVPNAPCGVERLFAPRGSEIIINLFLMHRVELKVSLWS